MTYLPGLPVVPCIVCGTKIDRRGKGGQGHRKYCSPPCRQIYVRNATRVRKGYGPRENTEICPRCNVNLRALRSDGRKRGWCRPCESAQKTQYMASPAGKATWQRYIAKRYPELAARRARALICWWCKNPIQGDNMRGRNSDTKHFCDAECRRQGQNYMKRLRYAARNA